LLMDAPYSYKFSGLFFTFDGGERPNHWLP